MKKILAILLGSILVSGIAFSQDTIVYKNGDRLASKVLEIHFRTFKYKEQQNLNGTVYSGFLHDLSYIKYENGLIDQFTELQK